MSDLPESWAQVPLAAITSDVTQRVPSDDETIRYIDISSVNRTTKVIKAPQKLLGKDAPSRARKQVATGDTLVSMTRPNLNAVALVPKELDGEIASTGFDVLRPVDEIDPRWVSYLVRTEEFVNSMSALVQGALYPAVRSKDVRAHVVPLAPAAEQTRIANQLDTLLTRIQSCNDRFDAIPALLKRYRQAVLDKATSGTLTEDWRLQAKGTSAVWKEVKLQEVISEMRNGLAQKPTEQPPGVKILRIGSVRAGQLDLNDHRYLEISKKEAIQYELRKDDLLFTRYNGSLEFVGVCVALKSDAPNFVYPDKLIRVRARSELALPKFIEIVFGSTPVRQQVESFVKSSAGQRGISGADLKSTCLQLAPLDEQAEIVRRVESLFALADRIETRATLARAHARRLSSLTLAKAFRGELVPQDAQDEPAGLLLERIVSQRNGSAAKKQSKATRQVRASGAPKEATAVTKSRQDENIKGKPYLADHLRRLGSPVAADVLFKASELTVADFYKQLAWEVAQGHIVDSGTTLEAPHAAG
jgi:type I restriction enzyme S subunit